MPAGRPFRDRAHAGRLLAEELAGVPGEGEAAVVVGLARGGVPVAAEVARALGAALDVLVVRKIGHPEQREWALGAVSEDGAVAGERVPEDAVAEQLAAARAQAAELRGGLARVPLAGRTAIVVDDGLATGLSMAAALHSVAGSGALRCLMAVPVAAQPGFGAVAAEVRCEARAVVVERPSRHFAVGSYYEDFTQVSDDEVRAALTSSGPGRRT
jgi:putative phosphoribosyl transferase